MVTGTLINYYFNCKRQCWLFYHRINMEDNSFDVGVGKALHDISKEGGFAEVKIDNIRIDKITNKYLIEKKKSDSNKEAAKWQILYYLSILEKKGIIRVGKIEYIEKRNKNSITEYVELTEECKNKLEDIKNNIEKLVSSEVPGIGSGRGCKRCAYFEYCYI